MMMTMEGLSVVIIFLWSLVVSQACPDLGELEYGWRRYNRRSSSGAPSDYDIEYGCHTGYTLEGTDSQVCNSDQKWVPAEKPVCRRVLVSKSESGIKCSLPAIHHGKVIDHTSRWKEVVCDSGYKLNGNYELLCERDGTWANINNGQSFPTCLPDSGETCLPISRISHADIVYSTSPPYGDRTKATIRCERGYRSESNSPVYLTCIGGQWEGSVPTCVRTRKSCHAPPSVPHASVEDIYDRGLFVEGTRIRYNCQKDYTLAESPEQVNNEALHEVVCSNGEWLGNLPTCVPLVLCDEPPSISDGHWARFDPSPYQYRSVEELNKIHYICAEGYKLLGQSIIWCQEDKTWSHIPPQCIPVSDPTIYCSSPGKLANGVCTCQGKGESYCAPFTPQRRWVCNCLAGYKLDGAEVLTCGPDGEWNHDMPTCVPLNDQDDQISTDLESSPTKDGAHISTLAIVVATACSVLGVLLLVMVAVIFRRHKPRPRLYHTAPVPPPYTRVDSNSAEEHDRVALIAYAEGRNIALPSYEEAMRGPQRMSTSVGSTNPAGGEEGGHGYRPLPPVPPMLRANSQTNSQMSGDNNNRYSTATSASTAHTRDGFSEVFGSLDTVNVSISDASTAGTVETVDSGASNPSLASRRANAGSLGSSNGSLANDDTRLIETSGHGGDGRILSTSSEPLPEEEKEE